MLKYLIKGLQAGLGVKLVDDYRRLSIQLLQIEATKCYLRGVQVARLSALGLTLLGLLITFMGLGMLLVHVAIFYLLPWSGTTKALIALFLGLGYVAAGGVALHRALREKTWMETSGAAEMLAKASLHADRR